MKYRRGVFSDQSKTDSGDTAFISLIWVYNGDWTQAHCIF